MLSCLFLFFFKCEGTIITPLQVTGTINHCTHMAAQPNITYRKIPKISPEAYIFQRPFLRGLSTEGNLRFKIDWARLIVGSKFTVFALFYFAFEGMIVQVQAPVGLSLEGRFNGGFFALLVWGSLYLEGLIHGGAYFRNFTVTEF